MMWEKQLSTAEMGNAVQDGTTLRVFSEKCQIEAVAQLDYTSNQLHLSMRSGDYVYQSESLVVSPLLDLVGTVQLLREGLERFLLLATLPYSKLESGWTPMELTTLLYKSLDHVLA